MSQAETLLGKILLWRSMVSVCQK